MSTVKAASLQNTGSGAPAFKNSSGTEIGQLGKAWVNFNGTGTVAIRDSFNVSGITDGGTGLYTVNFASSFADSDYACVFQTVSASDTTGSAVVAVMETNNGNDRTASSVRIRTMASSGSNLDRAIVSMIAFSS